LKAKQKNVTVLHYKKGYTVPLDEDWGEYTIHWECDLCASRFKTHQGIMQHVLSDHGAEIITIVEVRE
jgi:hypothetical protein